MKYLKERLFPNGGEMITPNVLPVTTVESMVSPTILDDESDVVVGSQARFRWVRDFGTNLQEVVLGTKLAVLFPAIPLAMAANSYNFGRTWIFGLSLLGLTPLAERVSFLTEQIAYFTGPTVGGLMNATCGNATELIIALLALKQNKIDVLKFSLLGSILSNLLLVLGTSLLFGGLSNLNQEQRFNTKEANVSCLMLVLGLVSQMMPLMLRYSEQSEGSLTIIMKLSRFCSILMLFAYITYIFFQLNSQQQQLPHLPQEDDEEEKAMIGFWSSFFWLIGMTIVIAILSEYLVGTIEDASKSWGISVNFIGIILLPIVGNAAEHAGSIIFAVKNKLDITMGIALGSATQISMFVVPLSVIVGWCMGIRMDLDFGLIETCTLALTIIITTFSLQDGSSHYIKGVVLLLCYVVISACFFYSKLSIDQ